MNFMYAQFSVNLIIHMIFLGSNDDWYWMYVTVYLKCHIVTNDEMRDHHFQMLSPR